MILAALKEVKEDNRNAANDSRETREALVKVTSEQAANKAEIERARKHRETLERRVTVIESQAHGSEKAGSNVMQYVSLLIALGAGVTGLVSILR